MAENLGTPLFAYEIIMPDDSTMRMELCAFLERKDKGFKAQTDKLNQVTFSCGGFTWIIHCFFFASSCPAMLNQ